MKSKILGLLAVGLLAGPIAAGAAVITYDFTTSGPYSGSFSYEDTNSTVAPAVPNYNTDITWYAALSFFVNGADVGPSRIGILDLSGPGGFTGIFVATNTGIVRMNFLGPTGLFSGEMISNANGRTMADFTASYFNYNYNPPTSVDTGYVVTSLTQRSVPEPGSLALLGLGLAGLGLSRRRKAN